MLLIIAFLFPALLKADGLQVIEKANICHAILSQMQTQKENRFYGSFEKRGAYYPKVEDIKTMFQVRDRINQQGEKSTLLNQAEAEAFSLAKGSKIEVGSKITMDQFEHLVLQIYYRYAITFANRPEYRDRGFDMSEVVQAAQIGQLRAIRKFDPNNIAQFSTYSTFYMSDEVNDFVMQQDVINRFGGHGDLMTRSFKLIRLRSDIKNETGKIPTNEELTIKFNSLNPENKPLTVSEASNLLGRMKNETVSTMYEDGKEIEFEADFGDPEAALNTKETKKSLIRLMKVSDLTSFERKVLILNYGLSIPTHKNQGSDVVVGEPMTLREIADVLGTTHQNVGNGVTRALNKLKLAKEGKSAGWRH